jgi:hypothetical protein
MQFYLQNYPYCFGRMADDPPPPPYIAAMMQQFMTGLLAQFPNQNTLQQSTPITLPEFVRLNPSTFHSSTDPMDADDWLRDIAF